MAAATLPKMTIEDRLYLIRYKADKESHLVIKDPQVCLDCVTKPCTTFCPAHVYEWEDNRITVSYEGCVECGACRIGCPPGNISWRYPRGGFGVSYKYG